MASTLPNINTTDWSLSTGAADELVVGIDDIAQCIDLILRTQPGTDPLRPKFGTRYIDHIDTPINIAAPRMVNEIVNAIELWEPRVVIREVKWSVVEAQVIYQVDWDSKYGAGTNIIPL